MITPTLLFNNKTPINTAPAPCERCECAATRVVSFMRGDMHLGRSKAGEKSFPFRAGSDWCELEGVSDDPLTRTPALPKAGHIRWMARNPSMTAAKTAVPSIPTNRSSGASGGRY